ncbi:hypothetical protein DRP77_10100 [Candidatus Poribacteria bacterium]|nr:MAG: hypothetical protein DRP77_10100 [Candidatus Poribacteria bacterium]
MNCNDIAPLLIAYVHNDLSDEEREAVESHLKNCPECSRTLEETIWTVELLERKVEADMESVEPLLGDLEVKVYRRLAAEWVREARRRWIDRLWFLRRPWAWAAYAAAALAFGVYIGSHHLAPERPADQPALAAKADECIRMRLRMYADEEAFRKLESAHVIKYVRGDEWKAWGVYNQVIRENPGTVAAMIASEEISTAEYKP